MTQDARTAAEVVTEIIGLADMGLWVMDDSLEFLAALAEAGYVVVDRGRVDRLMASAEDIQYWWELIMGYEEHKHPDKRTEPPNTCLPSDFDPLPTQEGEPFVLTLDDVTLVPTQEGE
jgi:hypothetical protein